MKTDNVIDVCIRSLEWARLRNYRGYSKFDALNSPLLRAVSKKSRLLLPMLFCSHFKLWKLIT